MPIHPQNRLRNSFAEVVKQQAAELVALSQEALTDPATREALDFELERIAGTAASLGLPVIERAARAAQGAASDASLLDRIARLAEACRRLEGISPIFRPVIVIGLSGVRADDLAVDLRAAADLGEALALAEAEEPAAFVVAHDQQDGLRQRLSGALRAVPIFVVGPEGDLAARVRASARGAVGYLGAPARLDRVLDHVRARSGPLDEAPRRVLVLDRDPEAARSLISMLGAGLEALAWSDPATVLQALDRHRPDLFLMSNDLGALDPAALILALRSHDLHGSMAILVLADRQDEGRLSLVTAVDDLILRPVDPDRLRSQLHARLRQQRMLDGERVVDRLTGLYSRRALLRAADREIGLCRRTGQLLSVVLLDVDSMGELNRRVGSATGDAVLAGLGRLLARTFRETDVLGRVGGDSFGVLLPACSAHNARRRVEAMRGALRELAAEHGAGEVDVSVGVADTTLDISGVMARADRALLQARADGGGRTLISAAED